MDDLERLCRLVEKLFVHYRGEWLIEPAHIMVQRLQSCLMNEMVWSRRVLMRDEVDFVSRALPTLQYAEFQTAMEARHPTAG